MENVIGQFELEWYVEHMKPTYFDFTVKDLEQAKAFFRHVFNWRFEKFPMPYDYYRIQAGAEGEPGIDGGIGAIADTPTSGGRPLTQVTIPVPNLDACIARVEQNGGTVIEPKMPIPGIGWFAACAEPGGLLFGVMEADPRAK
ncbi:MAG: VOC family protein [Gammaproteobacteria bacterium]|nr:VOC family protein [Gammaproteobacteria bacterium]